MSDTSQTPTSGAPAQVALVTGASRGIGAAIALELARQGYRVTGTATDAANNTSEFGPNTTVTAGVAGRVFEDLNYGGGAGRNWATASADGAVGRPGARVEIGSISGGVVTVLGSATTAADGSYVLPTTGAGSYMVRVVSETVSSSRSGWVSSLRPVLTYAAHAPGGTRVERTDFVGGLSPAATCSYFGSY